MDSFYTIWTLYAGLPLTYTMSSWDQEKAFFHLFMSYKKTPLGLCRPMNCRWGRSVRPEFHPSFSPFAMWVQNLLKFVWVSLIDWKIHYLLYAKDLYLFALLDVLGVVERLCVVNNLILPKEKSGLCPRFLGSNLKILGISCLIDFCLPGGQGHSREFNCVV